MTRPSTDALRLLSGFRAYQLVLAACRLKLPDLIAADPQTADELSAATGTHAPTLRRALRGLAAWRVFTEDANARFHATPLSDEFRSDRPGLRNMTLQVGEEYEPWGHLIYSIRTGEPAYQHLHGRSPWEKLAENPELAAQFNAAMVETTRRIAGTFAAAYDFDGAHTVVDVGGGSGALLVAVLQAHPDMRGILFDLAAGLAGAPAEMKAQGLESSVTLVAGSFFESVPSGGDLYLLKSIIHDWDDEHARAILKTCRMSMQPGSRLVVLERSLPEHVADPDSDLPAVMADLNMMVLLGGRERTIAEYGDLFSHSGLRLNRSVSVGEEFVAVEAVPV